MSTQIDLPAIGTMHEQSRLGKLARSLGVLALEKKTWSSFSMLGVFWRLMTNMRRHRHVLSLRWNPVYAAHLENDPRFLFKYLTHDYMARRMTVEARAASFVHHYRRIYAELPDLTLGRILSGEVTMLRLPETGAEYSITLGLSKPWDKEGELSLNLRLDGQLIYILSFSIVPGWVVGASAPEVLLIGRMQGERGGKQAIAQAAKVMCDVAPPALLLAALEGVGEALGIYAIASVQGEDQTSYRKEFRKSFIASYDQFFAGLDVSMNEHGYFLTPVPIPEKPMATIKRGHKIRTKAKREIKRKIAVEMCMALRSYRRMRLLAFPPSEYPEVLARAAGFLPGE